MLIIGPADVDERLAVDRVGGVEVDEPADAVGGPVGDAGDHHAAVAVADEDDVAQVLEREHVDDVGDVRVEVDVGIEAGGSARRGR